MDSKIVDYVENSEDWTEDSDYLNGYVRHYDGNDVVASITSFNDVINEMRMHLSFKCDGFDILKEIKNLEDLQNSLELCEKFTDNKK